jgi:hypothetical protein
MPVAHSDPAVVTPSHVDREVNRPVSSDSYLNGCMDGWRRDRGIVG